MPNYGIRFTTAVGAIAEGPTDEAVFNLGSKCLTNDGRLMIYVQTGADAVGANKSCTVDAEYVMKEAFFSTTVVTTYAFAPYKFGWVQVKTVL